MAANWNNPTLTSLYVDFLAQMKERDTDILRMDPGTTGAPSGAKRFNSALSVFQEWNGSAWNTLVLSAAGGGTGSGGGLPALGTMASQNSNAVAITGGSITNVALDAGAITVGTLALARGGTGAPLALGGAGSFLQSNGAQVVFGVNGGSLTGLNAGAITGGRLPMANMPVGGDWDIASVGWFRITGAFISGAGLGNTGPGTINASAYYLNNAPFTMPPPGDTIPSGMMATFDTACPAGWSLVNIDSRFIIYNNTGGGGVGGSTVHGHTFSVPAGGGGDVNSGAAQGEDSGLKGLIGNNRSFDSGSSFSGYLLQHDNVHGHTIGHTHTFNVPGFPGHSGNVDNVSILPPYIIYVLCRKN